MRKVVLMLVILCGAVPQAWAACTASFSSPSASFGTQVTSFVLNGAEQLTSLNLVMECDRTLTLLTNDSATLTLTGATNVVSDRAAMKRTDNTAITDLISLRTCGRNACANSSEITRANAGYTWNGALLLTLLGSSRYTLPIFFRTAAGQNVSAGPYQVRLDFNLFYNICATGTILTGCSVPQTDNLPLTLLLNITVTNDCTTLTAPAVSFGTMPLPRNFPVVNQAISVTCTKGSTYTVGIDNGLNPNGNVRQMASNANRMSYEIYKSGTTSRWGAVGDERWASAASSAVSTDGLLRTYNYSAQVLPNQAPPPGGTYTDTLTVDLVF